MDLLSELVATGRKATSQNVRNIAILLEHAVPVRIQPVSEYLYTGTDQEYFELGSDFPNLAPPWPLFFMTWKQPLYSLSEGKIIPNPLASVTDLGSLCVAADLTKTTTRLDNPPEARWLLSFELFVRARDEGIIYQRFCFNVKENGDYCTRGVDAANGMHEFIGSESMEWPLERKDWPTEATAAYTKTTLFPAFLAISFCHCKNVRVDREVVPEKVLKKRLRTREWSPAAWHSIVIEPMCKIMKTEERDPTTGKTSIRRAVVSRRAHFKTFTEESKLFGRHTGTYFWPAVQKANTEYLIKAAGRIVK